MSTGQLIEINSEETVLTQYHVSVAEAHALADEYRGLTIAGTQDKKGLQLVQAGAKVLAAKRIEIEKRRKELKDGALKFGQMVDGCAKKIAGPIIEVEEELKAKIKAVNDELERIKAEAMQVRFDKLQEVEAQYSVAIVQALSDADFDEFLFDKTTLFQERKDREAREAADKAAAEIERLRIQAEEDAKRKAEQEQIAKDRAELEKLRQEQEAKAAAERAELDEKNRLQREEQARIEAAQKAESDRIEAARQKLIDDEAAAVRKAEAERVAKEAAEQARIAAEKKAADEAAALAKAEQLRPDREKLLKVAVAVSKVKLPEVSEDSAGLLKAIEAELLTCAENIIELIDRAIPAK